MPRSSGTYSRVSGTPYVYDTDIDEIVVNSEMDDIAVALTQSIARDGQTTITANIPFNNNKITGLGAGTARTDAASLATIQDGTGVYVGTVGGTADVITLTPSPAITAYAAGQQFHFIASGANTTNVTLNVSGLGAKAVTKSGSVALAAGDIPSGDLVIATYDGTRFQIDVAGATKGANGDITSLTACTSITAGTVTVATGDLVYVQDVSAGNVLKVVTAQSIADLVGQGVPAGTIITYGGNSLPTGYLDCNGAAVSRATYAALFTAIGTLWGIGDGSTTFNVPNISAGYALLKTSGTIGASTSGEVKAHTHQSNVQTATQLDSNSVGGGSPVNGGTQQTGSTGGSANLAAGVYVFMCIKY